MTPYVIGVAIGLAFAIGWAFGYKRAIRDVRRFMESGER